MPKKSILIRLTDEEYGEVEEMAGKGGKSVASVVTAMVREVLSGDINQGHDIKSKGKSGRNDIRLVKGGAPASVEQTRVLEQLKDVQARKQGLTAGHHPTCGCGMCRGEF